MATRDIHGVTYVGLGPVIEQAKVPYSTSMQGNLSVQRKTVGVITSTTKNPPLPLSMPPPYFAKIGRLNVGTDHPEISSNIPTEEGTLIICHYDVHC